MKTFNVGELVKVVDKGETYDFHVEAIKESCPELLGFWQEGTLPNNGEKFLVVAKHVDDFCKTRYIIRSIACNKVYVVGERAIESLDKPQPKRKFTEDQINEAKSVVGGIVAEYLLNKKGVSLTVTQTFSDTVVCVDGKTRVARRNHNDEFNKYIGFMIALCRASNNEKMIPSWVYGK